MLPMLARLRGSGATPALAPRRTASGALEGRAELIFEAARYLRGKRSCVHVGFRIFMGPFGSTESTVVLQCC